MIQVFRGKEVRPGKWAFYVQSVPPLSGVSRQPLLDACRLLKRAGADPCQLVALFREGKCTPDLTCELGKGAELTIIEDDRGIRQEKWKAYDGPRARKR